MFDIITLGTATKDIFVNGKGLKSNNKNIILECGKKVEVQRPFIQVGGGATNTAVAFSRLGLHTAAITKIGKDEAGHLVKKCLDAEGVFTSLVVDDNKEGTAISLVVVKTGIDRAVLVYRGASQRLDLKDIRLKDLNTKWIYVSALRGESVKVLTHLLKYCNKKGIKVAMNPGSKELEMPGLLRYVNVLLLNLEEARRLSNETHLRNIFAKLVGYGPKIIAITAGVRPVFVLYHGKILCAEPLNRKVVSTLGAGDAFCSGFVASLIINQSIDSAIRIGLLNSYFVIQKFGAKSGLIYLKDINKHKRLLSKIKVRSARF